MQCTILDHNLFDEPLKCKITIFNKDFKSMFYFNGRLKGLRYVHENMCVSIPLLIIIIAIAWEHTCFYSIIDNCYSYSMGTHVFPFHY